MKNAPRSELRSGLQLITGADLTWIDGIDVMVAQTLISEMGLDMSRWKTEAHFSSWLGLCPDNRTSGNHGELIRTFPAHAPADTSPLTDAVAALFRVINNNPGVNNTTC